MSELLDDGFTLAREQLQGLALDYGVQLAFDIVGMGSLGSIVDFLMLLSELVGADEKRSGADKAATGLLIDDLISHYSRAGVG